MLGESIPKTEIKALVGNSWGEGPSACGWRKSCTPKHSAAGAVDW